MLRFLRPSYWPAKPPTTPPWNTLEQGRDKWWTPCGRPPWKTLTVGLKTIGTPEVVAWASAQQSTTRAFLDALPERESIRSRCEELYNHPRVGIPRTIGERIFLSRNNGLQNQSVTFVQKEDGTEEVFLDPNGLSEDGTVTAGLSGASPDGRHVVEVRNAAGSDWQEMRVLDVATGESTGEVLKWVKFSGAAWVDGGFYYSRYPAPEGSAFSAENTFHSVYFHKVGTPQEEDVLVFRNEDEPNRYHFVNTTEDGQFAVLNTSTGTDGNSLHVLSLAGGDSNWKPVVEGFESPPIHGGTCARSLVHANRHRCTTLQVGRCGSLGS